MHADWDKAELKLPNIHLVYRDGKFVVSAKIENDTSKVFRILLPPYETWAIVNGRKRKCQQEGVVDSSKLPSKWGMRGFWLK